jgi:hypothetical protein
VRVRRREVVDVLVVVEPPQPRAARREPQECPHVPAHVRRVQQVGRHHAEPTVAALAQQHSVIANGEPWALERRLRDVVDLVPGRVGAHPREPVVEPAKCGAVGTRCRSAADGSARVAAAHEAAAVGGERDEHVLAAGAGGGHERHHLGLLPGAGPVPRNEVADALEPQVLPRRAAEHRRALLGDPHAVPGVGGSGPEEQGDE